MADGTKEVCCRNCGMPHSKIEPVYIPVSEESAIFALCVQCFVMLDTDTVVFYTENALYKYGWHRNPVELKKQIQAAVSFLKNFGQQKPPFKSAMWPERKPPHLHLVC